MRRTLWMFGLFVAAGSAAVAFAMQGCGTIACSETQTCVPAGDGGGDHTGDGPIVTDGATDAALDGDAGCNPNGDPATEPCVIADGYGVFVAPYGMDVTGTGSAEQPFKTIGFALMNLTSANRVYVCATQGSYDEQVKVGTTGDGVSIFGGLSCPAPDAGASDAGAGGDGGNGWSYVGTPLAKVSPTTQGFALEIDTITKSVTVEDMEFDAQDESEAGAGTSSIAVMVNNAGMGTVAFARDRFVAGGGAAGQTIMTAPATNWSSMDGGGMPANGINGGGGVTITCGMPANGSSTGGGGGGLASQGNAGSSNPSANPMGVDNGGAGSGATSIALCTNGYPGASGAGGSGGPGADGGALLSSGWSGAAGTQGTTGDPGQGGGGGGGALSLVGGGGGGAGGCGGATAAGGGPGGASIALEVLNGALMMTHCTLMTGNAGFGGTGGTGENGQGGGNGGQAVNGCNGGQGGQGGGGGGGGGGSGGPSVGIAWSGLATPLVEDASVTNPASSLPPPSTFTGGSAGSGGTGGQGGSATNGGAQGQNGSPGIAAAAAKY